ncbi:MAG: hypothetical protein QOJ09_1467 [Actinomycetota bacterium]|nr:hypothetical protein [Actinomycetota bacterium]
MRRRVLTTFVLLTALVAGLLGLVSGPARAAVSDPVVTGPIGTAGIHGHALFDSWYDLSREGYRDDEYFVSGTARSFADPTKTAPYTTRIVVTRPSTEARFNGTVLLDWVNVTAQFENAVDSVLAHQMLLREGFAVVAVSAQSAGVCCTPLTPKVWDPVRYASLSHPGDDFAYDIFSQVAQAVRAPGAVAPLGPLHAVRVLAAGQSQSASKLDTYVRQVQPHAQVIDGFLIHGGGSKIWEPAPSVPVLQLFSDREATPERPNTLENYRLWEAAGSSHADFWIGYHQEMGQGPRTVADAPQKSAAEAAVVDGVAGNYGEQVHPLQGVCIAAGALFPMRYATAAALHHLDQWVRHNGAPPVAPPYAFDATGSLAKDQWGNAMGGIRLPPIDNPVARYQSTTCNLGGVTIPLTEPEIAQLYPTHADYYARMVTSTNDSVAAGFLLPEDAADLLSRACAAKNRWPGDPGADC